ncbi:MAG: hypothetical protein N2557_03590 [Hydrogenophilus sp.]|nr:hypothetical protein [Hydrogenophilus sp.]
MITSTTRSVNNPTPRERLGQYFTPPSVVRLMLALGRLAPPILEPAAGNGAFLAPLLDRYPPQAIDAIECDPAIAHPAARIGNYFALDPSRRYRTIIGNPPYVRARWIDAETRRLWKQLAAIVDLPLLDGRANLAYYFIADAVRRLLPGGELIFIVPRDFLQATAAAPLNRYLLRHGAFTHLIDLGDRRLFSQALPNCVIFRYLKAASQGVVRVSQIPANAPLPEDPSHLLTEERHLVERGGQLYFPLHPHPLSLRHIAAVKVGGVSGADAIFADPRHANRHFVCAHTVRTGRTRPMYWPDPDHPPLWLLPHRPKLLARRVRRFDESNWWHWGRGYPLTDAPRIYVPVKTRAVRPFFLHPSPHFDGAVLALFPHNPHLDLTALCRDLNAVDWQALGFRCDGRYLFSQRSLQNAPLPAHFARYLPPDSSLSATPLTPIGVMDDSLE